MIVFTEQQTLLERLVNKIDGKPIKSRNDRIEKLTIPSQSMGTNQAKTFSFLSGG